MSKTLVLKIETCVQCTHLLDFCDPEIREMFVLDECKDDYTCGLTKKNFKETGTIPDWCPLPDAKIIGG
jgi:hypothetical protein